MKDGNLLIQRLKRMGIALPKNVRIRKAEPGEYGWAWALDVAERRTSQDGSPYTLTHDLEVGSSTSTVELAAASRLVVAHEGIDDEVWGFEVSIWDPSADYTFGSTYKIGNQQYRRGIVFIEPAQD
jgi:hypothetical protein